MNKLKRIQELEKVLKPVPLPKLSLHYPDGTIEFEGRTFTKLAEYKAFISGITADIFEVKIVNQKTVWHS